MPNFTPIRGTKRNIYFRPQCLSIALSNFRCKFNLTHYRPEKAFSNLKLIKSPLEAHEVYFHFWAGGITIPSFVPGIDYQGAPWLTKDFFISRRISNGWVVNSNSTERSMLLRASPNRGRRGIPSLKSNEVCYPRLTKSSAS